MIASMPPTIPNSAFEKFGYALVNAIMEFATFESPDIIKFSVGKNASPIVTPNVIKLWVSLSNPLLVVASLAFIASSMLPIAPLSFTKFTAWLY